MKKRKVRWDRVLLLILAFVGAFQGIRAAFQPKECGITCVAEMVKDNPAKLSDYIAYPEFESIGEFRITFYCAGSCCNGHNAGVDCKGNPLVTGTIATNDLPYGTHVWMNIDGMMQEYVVRDRMAKKERSMPAIDIFVDAPHDIVQNMGVLKTEVFIKK